MNQNTSVSMTINGPAPAMVGYFMNTAIDQQCEKYIREHGLEKEAEEKIKLIYNKIKYKLILIKSVIKKGRCVSALLFFKPISCFNINEVKGIVNYFFITSISPPDV